MAKRTKKTRSTWVEPPITIRSADDLPAEGSVPPEQLHRAPGGAYWGFFWARRRLPDPPDTDPTLPARWLAVQVLTAGWQYPLVITNRFFPEAYDDVWYYQSAAKALSAAARFDPTCEQEPTGWFRHPSTGRRRPHGNPDYEHIRF